MWVDVHSPDAREERSQAVTVSVPLNTSVVGSPAARRELRVPSDLLFSDFFSRVCANMDLDPSEAQIGYKFHNDRAKDAPRELSKESDYLAMMQEMNRKILCARTRNPVLFLHNLVRASLSLQCYLSDRIFTAPSNPHSSVQTEAKQQPNGWRGPGLTSPSVNYP